MVEIFSFMALVISSEEKVIGCYIHRIAFYPLMKISSSFYTAFFQLWQEEMMIVNFFQIGSKGKLFLLKELIL